MKNLVQMYFHIVASLSSGLIPGGGIAVSEGKCLRSFIRYGSVPLHGVVLLCISTSNVWGCLFPQALLTVYCEIPLIFFQSDSWEIVSQCMFNLHSS